MRVEAIAQAARSLEPPDNLTLPEAQLYWTLAALDSLYRRGTVSPAQYRTQRDQAIAAYEQAEARYRQWLQAGAVWRMMQRHENAAVRALAAEMDNLWTAERSETHDPD